MKKMLVFALFLLLLTIPATAQDDETILRWGFPADGSTFNTVLQTEAVDSALQGFLFPQLARTNVETGAFIPYLAEWDISDDGTVYTFSIAENANWSDGTPITAQDVAFTFGAITSDAVETFRTVPYESLNVIDDKTFEIVLAAPTCGLFSDLSVGILPSHVFAEDYSDFTSTDFNLNPTVAGGPFVFDERAVDEFLRFRANPDFFLGAPSIDQILVQVIPDTEVMTQAMASGQIDITSLPQDQIDLLAGNPNIEVATYPLNGWTFVQFNLGNPANPQPAFDEDGNRIEQEPHPILGDVRVREALVLGWDHEDAQFLQPAGELLYGPIMPVLPQYLHPTLERRPYDPDRAAELLEQAGWVDTDGDGVRDRDGEPLLLELGYIRNSFWDNVVALMADYLGDIGVDIVINTYEQGAFFGTVLPAQDFDMALYSVTWGQPTPDILLNFVFRGANDPGTNFASFSDEEFDQILDELVTAPCAAEERAPLYHRIQELAYELVPQDFIITNVASSVTNTRLQNVNPGTWGSNPVWEWTISN